MSISEFDPGAIAFRVARERGIPVIRVRSVKPLDHAFYEDFGIERNVDCWVVHLDLERGPPDPPSPLSPEMEELLSELVLEPVEPPWTTAIVDTKGMYLFPSRERIPLPFP